MNNAHVNGRIRRLSNAKPRPAARRTPFKVFIGYADLAAVRDATATIADAIRSSGRNFEIHPLLWRYEQLASDYWRERAVQAALSADVIVLASSNPGTLSPGVERWLAEFLDANRGHRATIVAIAGLADAWTISIEEPVKRPALVDQPLITVPVAEAELQFAAAGR